MVAPSTPLAEQTRAFVILLLKERPFTEAVIERHVAFLHDLESRNALVIAGPFRDGAGGMVVIRAGDPDEAMRIAQRDPFVSEGFETCTVREIELVKG